MRFVFGIPMSAFLGVIYCVAMGVATFIEGDVSYGAAAAKELVYNALWFDILHACLMINLIGVFIYHKIYRSRRYHALLLHLSLIVIVGSAGVTRYFGFEGAMHIREGYSSDIVVSFDEWLKIAMSVGDEIYAAQIPVSYSLARQTRFDEKVDLGGSQFAFKYIDYEPSSDGVSAPKLTLMASYGDDSEQIILEQNFDGQKAKIVSLNGIDFEFSWGPKSSELPFSLFLEDFVLDRYAGSKSPAGYASDIVVKDGDNETPYRIFMNNVLDYKGYRFFQSSYDLDEAGTILNVNKDPGKIPTYIGYTMLIIGFLWGYAAKNSRFIYLARKLKQNGAFGLLLCVVLFGAVATELKAFPSQQSSNDNQTASFSQMEDAVTKKATDEDIKRTLDDIRNNLAPHAKMANSLLVRDFDGRIKPLGSLAAEVIRKISHTDEMFGLNSTELILSMMTYYDAFQRVKMFYVANDELKELLNTPKNQKYISFSDAFDGDEYKLHILVEEANRKEPAKRSALQKEILKLDEKISYAYAIYTAQILNIFPDITAISGDGDLSKVAWLSPADAIIKFSVEDARKIKEMLEAYFSGIDSGVRGGEWSGANGALNALKSYQNSAAIASGITPNMVKMELVFNDLDPFNKLMSYYLILGSILMVLGVIALFRAKPLNSGIRLAFSSLLALGLLAHTAALIIRWIIADHAPWSNAYESMIYIAWAGVFAGVVVFRGSILALSASAVMSAITLFVAHLGFMDPQITPLVPVLKSYWLNIHVSVITASYGFFGFSFVMGVLALLFYIARGQNRASLDDGILNLSYINEMSLWLGLGLLTAGNFLGGVWANESWGRYWGWDSKETWSLITIVVYAAVLHMRLMRRFASAYALNVGSVVAFFSVLMTYFGVNFYLTGKHSYASGEMIPIPGFVYAMVGGVVLLIVLASFKRDLKEA